MRSKKDQPFVEMLNRFRTASQTEHDIKQIQSRQIDPEDKDYLSDAIHIYAENKPVDEHNNNKLTQLSGEMFHLRAADQYPPNVSQTDIDRVLSKGRSDTGGLDKDIHVKEGARVMLTSNIDIADRLINGQIGTIMKIQVNMNTQKPTVIYVKFDDVQAGKTIITKSTNQFVKEHNVVPIEPILAKIKIRPGKPSSPEIQRVQFPITLAYAVTIHKVQGLSLDKVVVSFELFRQRSFNYGQVYVALSRARSLSGLYTLDHQMSISWQTK
ncbi:ATP-dependent DNA helicase PIF1-like [Exaiptasia diaphana]|uniref:DNA replication helicase domain-containing protein n=1 Tax=Exaiptasia diaphana TaxID=2652724 RepID=A0A913YTR2_EXADI|nr:ATP-dependent DNA helicase PIF1-like [Exaiptasia diaphana]